MKKLLIVSPHFSTGGAPQVTLEKIRLLCNDLEIKVVEHDFLSSHFIVQRTQVIDLVGPTNFHTLSGTLKEKGEQLEKIISDFSPEYVSMEEFPEMFMDIDAAERIYNSYRSFLITETTHDSSFDKTKKRLEPDLFVFVSAYSALKYANMDVPIELVEYPVDHEASDKELNRQVLKSMAMGVDFDRDYVHVVIVGLFTPRKNQKYAFELADALKDYKIKFHFLGNQADNFADYWKPLMDSKPDNCIIWGERKDIDTFIRASDLFLFTSKGDRGNKELNPIVIKEACKYKYLPKLIFNLDVYLNKYNHREAFHYLNGTLEDDTKTILKILKPTSMNPINDKEIIIIGTHPNLKEREQLTLECIRSLRPLNRKILLVSHYPVPSEIQDIVDFYVYDKQNPLTHHSYYTRFYNYMPNYDVEININGLNNSNQSFAVLKNLYNSYKYAESLGYEKAFYITYDVIVDRRDYDAIDKSFQSISETNKAYLSTIRLPFGTGIQTTAMTFDVGYFLKVFDDVRDVSSYNSACERLRSQNFLEDYMMRKINETQAKDVTLLTNDEQTYLIHSGLGVSSNSEYYSIVPVKGSDSSYMFYFFTYNIDKRVVHVTIKSDNSVTKHIIDIQNQREYKTSITYQGKPIKVLLEFFDGSRLYKTEEYEMNEKNISKYKNTGYFKWKSKPRIKLLHLQTTLDLDKEIASREQLQDVEKHGWKYVRHPNIPYTDLPPSANCQRPNCISIELFDEATTQEKGTALTPAHYGCYDSFRFGILSEFDDEYDFLMVCEGDCKIEMNVADFVAKVEQSCENIITHNIGIMSFGDTSTLEHGWPQSPMVKDISEDMYVTNHIIGLQSIMFPKFVKRWLFEKLRTALWDASDLYFNNIFIGSEYNMGIVKKRLTTQFDGFSLIDRQNKKFI